MTSKPQRRNAPAASLDHRFELWRASWPMTAICEEDKGCQSAALHELSGTHQPLARRRRVALEDVLGESLCRLNDDQVVETSKAGVKTAVVKAVRSRELGKVEGQ